MEKKRLRLTYHNIGNGDCIMPHWRNTSTQLRKKLLICEGHH